MKAGTFAVAGSFCATSILGLSLVCGCNNAPVVKQHPDEVDSVNNALSFNGLYNVQVAQDRTKGVITLTGKVASPEQKAQAAQIASTNAGDYTITNKIGVTQPAAQASADSKINDDYEAMLKAHKDLQRQKIEYKVDHGTLILSGMVEKAPQRREAVDLAKSVPNVQHVVDQIKVKS